MIATKAPSGCCRWRTAAKLVAWLLVLLALLAFAATQGRVPPDSAPIEWTPEV